MARPLGSLSSPPTRHLIHSDKIMRGIFVFCIITSFDAQLLKHERRTKDQNLGKHEEAFKTHSQFWIDTWLKICGRVFRFASPRFKMNKVMRRGPSVDLLRGKNSNAACILLLLLSARFTGGGHRTQATLPLHLPPTSIQELSKQGWVFAPENRHII